MKLRTKMLVGILGTVVFSLVIIGTVVNYAIQKNSEEMAKEAALDDAREAAFITARQLEAYSYKMDGLSLVIENMMRDNLARRKVAFWVGSLLNGFPDATATWIAFEPNQFNGPDENYINKDGFGPKGRMVVLYTRSGNAIKREAVSQLEEELNTGEFYNVPFSKGQSALIEPYFYTFPDGQKNFIVTLARPIRFKGKIAGVIGIDINLEAIQTMINSIRTTDNSTKLLLSTRGTIVGTSSTDLLGVALTSKESSDKLGDIEQHIASGNATQLEAPSRLLSEKSFFSFYPIQVSDVANNWSLLSVVPRSEAMAEATALGRQIALYFVLITIMVTGAILYMIRNILHPIHALTSRLEAFSQLDFTKDDSKIWLVSLKDEIGDMARSLKKLQINVVDTLKYISDQASNFMDNAQTLASLSQQSVASTEEVKASVDQAVLLSQNTLGSIEQANSETQHIADTATTNASSAEEGAAASAQTAVLNERMTVDVREMTARITDAGKKSKDSGDSIRKVNQSVSSIANFVSTITGIADQTNLLALNAAIEAARAGEAGRGFAVVAEEVRKLAEESNVAAHEVEKLIGALQTDTHSANSIITEMQGILAETVSIAQETESELQATIQQTDALNNIMQNIAATAEEQAASSSEMSRSMRSVTEDTQNVVGALNNIHSAMEETARSSEHVAEEAQQMTQGVRSLQEQIAQFRLDDSPIGDNQAKAALGTGKSYLK